MIKRITGLSSLEARTQQSKYGFNELPSDKKVTWINILLSQFKSPLIYILFVVGIISLLYKEYFDFYLIEGVIVLNVIMGFVQEYGAYRTFESLRKMVSSSSLVLRNGKRVKISSRDIVPNDIVILGPGDKIPADGVLQRCNLLIVKEAILTGESEGIEKSIEGDNRVYMGTDVLSGEGLFLVKKIGRETELGKIGKGLSSVEDLKTPLQKSLEKLSKQLGILIIFLSLLIFAIGVIVGNDPVDMFKVSIILAVAGIPEGLPIAVTVILSASAKRILKAKGLVKQLLSVETLGSTTVICLDKTGTLTEGNMKVIHTELLFPQNVVKATVLANEQRTNMEIALWKHLKKEYKTDFNRSLKDAEVEYKQPFSSENKYSHTIGGDAAYIIGAPEVVLTHCNLSKDAKTYIKATLGEWTNEGLRTLAFASKSEGDLRNLDGYEWDGMLAIDDPVRDDVAQTIQLAQEAGLKVKIITGDHKITTLRIVNSLGLDITEDNILEGYELDKLSDTQLRKKLDDITIFARVTPSHKLRIVDLLQKNGEVVAMTGDGVNDAQALRKADIGVVMGDSSDLAKEAGDLILLNNDFKVIIDSIEQGRLVFVNLKKTIAYVLSNSLVEIIIILGGILLKLPAPLLVGQILWKHLICDGPPDIVLGLESKEQDLLKDHRNYNLDRKRGILDRSIIVMVLGVSLLIGLIGLFIYIYFMNHTQNLNEARTILFASIASVDLIYIYSFKSLRTPIFKIRNFFDNKWIFAASIYGFGLLLVAIYLPAINKLIETVPINPMDFLLQIGIGVISIAWVEVIKYLIAKKLL